MTATTNTETDPAAPSVAAHAAVDNRPRQAGQEIALIPRTAADRWLYAESMAASSLIPGAFRGRAADVFWATEYGAMLGLSPVAAMTGIHVMDGKPTASAALMSALVRRAGHRLRVSITGKVSDGSLTATAELTRADDPDHTFTAVWDLYRAERAGLLTVKRVDGRVVAWSRSQNGKAQNWEKYPEAMAKARAISEVCRDGAEECLFGMHYTAEELGAQVDEDGGVVAVTVEQTPTPPQGVPAQAGPKEDVVDAEILSPDPSSEAHATAVTIAYRAAASSDRGELLRTYTGLTEASPALLLQDITDDVDDAWFHILGDSVAEEMHKAFGDTADLSRIALGAWLIACGKHVKETELSVADTAALDPANDARPVTNPSEPWAIDPDAGAGQPDTTPATDGADTTPEA